MIDAHYENPKLAKLYDLDSGWSADRDFYLSLPGSGKQSILDLGCGTGLLCNAFFSKGYDVTGVDPSATMLKIARRKSYGQKIKWVCSPAQSFITETRFDLIIMTGHAFQVLLQEADVRATFQVVARHLKPGGSFVFETRNPEIEWHRKWDYDMEFKLPEGNVYETRRFRKMKNALMTFDFIFQFPDEKIVTQSNLRFWSLKEIEKHLLESGLLIERLFGDWNSCAFDSKSSEEMIFLTRLKPLNL